MLRGAVDGEYAATFASTLMRGLEKPTLAGYGHALRRLLSEADKHPDREIRWVLEHRLLTSARTDTSSGPCRKLLSAVRLLEKVGWLEQPLVRRGDWLVVEAMERHRARTAAAPQRQWASMAQFEKLAGMAETFGDWEVVALAAVSGGLLLRASEAATVRLDGGEALFQGAKSRRGRHHCEVGRWTLAWLEFLASWRAAHGHRPDQPASFRGAGGLHTALRSLLAKGGGECASLRWHSFRRWGAAQLHGLGPPPSAIHLYGGWATPKVAKIYTHPPSGWVFDRGSGVPFPIRDGKKATVEQRPGTSFGMFPSWIRREILWENQQMAEARGRRPRAMVDAAVKAKRARTTSAAAAWADSDDDDD